MPTTGELAATAAAGAVVVLLLLGGLFAVLLVVRARQRRTRRLALERRFAKRLGTAAAVDLADRPLVHRILAPRRRTRTASSACAGDEP